MRLATVLLVFSVVFAGNVLEERSVSISNMLLDLKYWLQCNTMYETPSGPDTNATQLVMLRVTCISYWCMRLLCSCRRCFFAFLFLVFIVHLLSFVPYTWNDSSHRRPALMVLTFPAAYHNRNVIFFSLVYIALLWLINFTSSITVYIVVLWTAIQGFYPATLCIIAVFAVARRLCVRPSVTLMHCIQTDEDIVKLLCRPGSAIILVFWLPAPLPNSKGNPFSGGAKYNGVGKFCDFWLKSPSISEMARDTPMVAMKR